MNRRKFLKTLATIGAIPALAAAIPKPEHGSLKPLVLGENVGGVSGFIDVQRGPVWIVRGFDEVSQIQDHKCCW